MMRDCPKVELCLPILVGIFVLVVFPAPFAIGQISLSLETDTTGKTSQDSKTPNNKSAAPSAGQTKLPACPDAGIPTLKPSANTGHHTVRLSWNASVIPSHSSMKVLGYCLYRSQTPHAAQKDATCKQCEQVNSTAVPETSYIDRLVQDSVTYYYVVTAAYGDKKITGSSNEATAKIPPCDPNAPLVSADSQPCPTQASATPHQ